MALTQPLVDLKQVLLEPGDLLLLKGPSRYEWTHGIDFVKEQMLNGRRVVRDQRVSVTLRRLKTDILLTENA